MLDNSESTSKIPRRKFLKKASLAAAGLTLTAAGFAACGDNTATTAPVATTAAGGAATTAAGGAATTAAGGAATTAAGGAAATTAAGSTKQFSGELRYLAWTNFVPAHDEELKRQADEWGKKNNVKVTVEYVANNQLQPKTVAAIEAKAGPDIIEMDYNWPWLYESALADVSKEYTALKSQLGGYYDVLESYSQVNGVARAIPKCIVPNAWVYRVSWLKEQGADKFPDNWDQFHDLGKKLKAAGHPMMQTMGHTFGDAPTMWYSFLWDYGGKEVEKDGKTVVLNSPETLKAVEAAVAIFKDCFDPVVFSWDDSSNNTAFFAEQVSATLNGASIYIKAKNDKVPWVSDLKSAPQPGGPAGKSIINLTKTQGVMNYGKNQDAAKEFIMWLSQPDQMNKWLEAGGGYSVGAMHAYDNHPVFTKDPQLGVYKDSVKDTRWYGWPGPPSSASSEVQSKYLIVDMFAKAAQGMAPKDAIAFTEGELKKIYGK